MKRYSRELFLRRSALAVGGAAGVGLLNPAAAFARTAGDPRPIWEAWDQFGITEARMHGWWDPTNPVKTGRSDILATSYVKNGKTMIAVASLTFSTLAFTCESHSGWSGCPCRFIFETNVS